MTFNRNVLSLAVGGFLAGLTLTSPAQAQMLEEVIVTGR